MDDFIKITPPPAPPEPARYARIEGGKVVNIEMHLSQPAPTETAYWRAGDLNIGDEVVEEVPAPVAPAEPDERKKDKPRKDPKRLLSR